MQEEVGTTILRILELKDKTHNLLTDPTSPWASAPRLVKILFEADGQKVKFNKIEDITTIFERKKGTTNICSKFFSVGGPYYTCSTCSLKNGEQQMRFCEDCWDPERHVNHNYLILQLQERNSGCCDCGRSDKANPHSFCPCHGSEQILPIEIAEEDRKKVVEFFQPLFMVFIYLALRGDPCSQDLGNSINEMVILLSERSLHYIRIFGQILFKPVQIQHQQKSTLLEALRTLNSSFEQVLFTLACDYSFLLKLAKCLIQRRKESFLSSRYQMPFGWGIPVKETRGPALHQNVLEMEWVLSKLAEQNIFVSDRNIYIKMLQNKSEASQKTFLSFINFFWQAHKNQHLEIILQVINTKNLKMEALNEEIKHKFLNELFDSQGKTNHISEKYKVQIIKAIIKLLLLLYDDNIQHLKDIRSDLEKLNITPQQLDIFLRNGCAYAQDLISDSCFQPDFIIVPFLTLILEASNKAELMQKFWIALSPKNRKFSDITNSINNLISHIIYYKINFPYLNLKPTEQDEMEKEKWLKEFLYEIKCDHGYKWGDKLKRNKKISFRNANKIIKDYCSCSEQQDASYFKYKSTEQHPNLLFRFFISYEKSSFENVPHNFNISKQFNSSSPLQDQIYELVFANNFMVQTYCELQKNFINQRRFDEKFTYWNLCYYILMLVYGHTLSHGKSKSIQEKISKIKNDPDILDLYCSFNPNPNLISDLLCINKEGDDKVQDQNKVEDNDKGKQEQTEEKVESPAKQHKMEEPQANENESQASKEDSAKKQKFVDQKEEMLENLQQQQEMILDMNPLQIGKVDQEEESKPETCLLCHETAQKDKNIVYLARLMKDDTLSSSFHGQQNKAGIRIQTCYHPVHSRCFMGTKQGKNMEFSCPQCSKNSNIFLPIDISDPVTLNQSENIIAALHVAKYKSIDFAMFPLLFKHLIESFGLGSLINLMDFAKEKKKKRANDQFILRMACTYYENMSETSRAVTTQQYHQLLACIDSCKNELTKEIQRILAVIIYQRITSGVCSYEAKQLMNLKEKMVEDEFKIFQESIEVLLNSKIELPEIPASVAKKSLSFQIIKLPKSAKELRDFGQQLCCDCHKYSRQQICLLCGYVYCRWCDGKVKHRSFHNNKVILFDFDIECVYTCPSVGGSQPAYLDPLGIGSKLKQKYQDGSTYQLCQARIERIVQLFLKIQ